MRTNPLSNRNLRSHVTQKPKNKIYAIKGLFRFLKKEKWRLVFGIIISVISNLLSLLGPFLSGKAIDAINLGAGKVDFERVYLFVILMLIFYFVSSIMSYFLALFMVRLSERVTFRMREEVFNHLTKMPVSFFDTNPTGDIISRISYDIDTINTSLSNDVITFFSSSVNVVGSFVMMLLISPVLVLIFVFTIPLSIVFTKVISKKSKALFRVRSSSLGDLNGFGEEIISAHKVVKAYQNEEYELAKFEELNNKAAEASYKAESYSYKTGPGVNFINNLSLALIAVFGSILYMYEKISLGNISSFVLYSRKFSGPINEFANIIAEFQSVLAASERVQMLLDEDTEEEDRPYAIGLKEVKGNVELEHVKFGYNESSTIIHDLSLKVKHGGLIAIVGPTGAGKTTIINLLMRFYDVESGTITVDENNIYDIKRKDLRKSYAMVLQDTWLFNGSFKDNIKYGNLEATDLEVKEAAKMAMIDHYIESLPKGYDTLISENGLNISKGQKQLVTIARAILQKSPMLILDEATSNVDTRTEQKIQQAMRNLMQNKTCFVIAHRLSTIQNADLILVLKDGDIVEQGTHEELLNNKGYYYSLFSSQFH